MKIFKVITIVNQDPYPDIIDTHKISAMSENHARSKFLKEYEEIYDDDDINDIFRK